MRDGGCSQCQDCLAVVLWLRSLVAFAVHMSDQITAVKRSLMSCMRTGYISWHNHTVAVNVWRWCIHLSSQSVNSQHYISFSY